MSRSIDVPIDPHTGETLIQELDRPTTVQLFEQELDEAHSKGPLRSWYDDAAERAAFERECVQWINALHARLARALHNHDLIVKRPEWREAEGVFYVPVYDANAKWRDYSVDIVVGEALALADTHSAEPLAAIVKDTIAAIFSARDRYHTRMRS